MDTGRNISYSNKNKKNIKIIKLILLTILLILMIGYTGNVQGIILWSDDFEDGNLDDWQLAGWNDASGTNVVTPHGITIINGELKTPDSSSSSTRFQAIKNSSTSVGTWSFDLSVNVGGTSEDSSVFNINFMFTELTGNYDLTGLNYSEFQWMGYGLTFLTIPYDGDNFIGTTKDFARPGINLIGFNGSSKGILLDSTSMSRLQMIGYHHIDITRDEDGLIIVYFDGIEIVSVINNITQSSEKFQLNSWLGGVSFDNIRISDVVEEILPVSLIENSESTISPISSSIILDDSNTAIRVDNEEHLFIPGQRQLTIGVLATLILTSLTGYYFIYLPKIKKPLLQFPKRVTDEISSVFHNRPSLLYLILSQKGKHPTPTEEDLAKSIPKEIFDYKFLMHPVRLAMTKVLFETIELTSIEIKNSLDLNWGDYSSHIKALLKQDYVYTREEFRDGSVKQVITLTDLGHRSYDQLKTILFDFLTNSPESYLNYVDKHYSDQIRFTETEE